MAELSPKVWRPGKSNAPSKADNPEQPPEDSETELIYLDLSELKGNMALANQKVIVEGLDTLHPKLCLQDGTVMDGSHQESIGSQIFLEQIQNTRVPKIQRAAGSKDAEVNVLGISDRIINFKNEAKQKGKAPEIQNPYAASKLVSVPASSQLT